MKDKKQSLFGMNLQQLSEVVAGLEMPRFATKQIARWLYTKGCNSIDQMTDISVQNRAKLSENYLVGRTPPQRETVSADGTKKYLYRAGEEHFIESAYIPDRDRATLCLSSQVGCRMGCDFCMTSRQGLQANLTTNQILNQFESLPEREKLTNIVYMGMGEPMDNIDNVMLSLEILTTDWGYGWIPTRITISTAGVIPTMRRLLCESRVHVAVSLHNPYSEERAQIMPIERAYPLRDVVALLKEFDFSHQRRVSFEYIVLEGRNHSQRHVAELARLLNGLQCRINLISFHKIPSSPYFSPDQRAMERFRDALSAKGITTTIRASRGEDIKAACGLLSTSEV